MFIFYCFLFLLLFLNTFLIFKSSISPLVFIFITYYYSPTKKDPIFKANFVYIFLILFFITFFNNSCDFVFFSFLFFFYFLILYFWKSNLYSRFLIFAFWYLLAILYLQKPNLQYPFILESEITGLTALSSFGLSFFSTRSPLSPPSPFSSLPNSVNLCLFQTVEKS